MAEPESELQEAERLCSEVSISCARDWRQKDPNNQGENMSKKMVFILLILAVAIGGFIAYTQLMMLRGG
jgi:hypothetical protein